MLILKESGMNGVLTENDKMFAPSTIPSARTKMIREIC